MGRLSAAHDTRSTSVRLATYERLFQHVQDVYFEITPEGRILDVTPSCARVLGRGRDELLNTQAQRLYAEPDEWGRLVAHLSEHGRLEEAELELEMPEGGSIHVAVTVEAVDDAEQCRLFVGTLREIERRKAAERALQLSEDRFRKAFYTSPDAISITRANDGKMVDVNQGFTDITGWTRQEAIGSTTLELGLWVSVETRERMAEAIETMGFVDNLETRFRTKDGSIIWGLFSAKLIELGGEPHLLSVARDMTEYKRLEQQLMQAQKMEAVGRLASGIAHDFNNLLTVIRGFARIARRDLPKGEPRAEAIDEIDNAAMRAANLTRHLLAFGRRQMLQPRKLELDRLVEDMAQLLRRLLPETTELRFEHSEQVGLVHADPGQLEQVLANLVVNARDAMPNGGHIVISTRNVSRNDESGNPRPWVLLSVRDDGVGMEETTQRRIFEPFFTTKERDRGTGLGLATVYGIVNQSGGDVEVESTPGEGSCFRIYLPRVEGAPERRGTDSIPSSGPLRGTETVLLAEDEGALRRVIAQALRQQGYDVLEAQDGARARDLAESHDGEIHALITDIVMPDTNGGELARQIRQLRPGLPVIFTSGYADASILASLPDDPKAALLRKVFTPEQLLRQLRTLLDD